MTRKDLKQIYDMMDKLDGIKNDQKFIDNAEAKGYKPFLISLNFKEDKRDDSTGMRKLNITQECIEKIYGPKKTYLARSKKCLTILMEW